MMMMMMMLYYCKLLALLAFCGIFTSTLGSVFKAVESVQKTKLCSSQDVFDLLLGSVTASVQHCSKTIADLAKW